MIEINVKSGFQVVFTNMENVSHVLILLRRLKISVLLRDARNILLMAVNLVFCHLKL